VDEENVKKAGLIGKEEEVGDELPF
jgi:hypothetical protein